jgi:hypothetical protein
MPTTPTFQSLPSQSPSFSPDGVFTEHERKRIIWIVRHPELYQAISDLYGKPREQSEQSSLIRFDVKIASLNLAAVTMDRRTGSISVESSFLKIAPNTSLEKLTSDQKEQVERQLIRLEQKLLLLDQRRSARSSSR